MTSLHYDRKFNIFIFLILNINVNKGVFCLIIIYLRIKSYNVLNYNNCSTDWNFPLKCKCLRKMTDARWWQYISQPFGSGELKRQSMLYCLENPYQKQPVGFQSNDYYLQFWEKYITLDYLLFKLFKGSVWKAQSRPLHDGS